MEKTASAEVITANGLKGSVDLTALQAASATELVGIELDNGQQLWVAGGSLLRQPDGHYLLPVAVPQREPAPGHLAADARRETTVIPVVAEEAVISTRPVDSGGVRISKVVHQREEMARAALTQEEIDIQRVPAGEFVAEAEPARQDGDTWIVPVYEEVLVVEKRLRLRERVRITKRRATTEQAQPVTLRHEEAIVERLDTDQPTDGSTK
jgi:uncharacterized protein (TIGR02271 family)